jgi:uncharacterized membrane protein YfcA
MNQVLIETVLGLLTGLFLGVTGIPPTGLILIALDYLKIGDYKSNLGAILFLNLFPITVGSVFEFYKSKQINFSLGFILLFSVIIGSFIGSKFIAGDKKFTISTKNIKYITAYLSLFTGIVFFISAQYDNSNS